MCKGIFFNNAVKKMHVLRQIRFRQLNAVFTAIGSKLSYCGSAPIPGTQTELQSGIQVLNELLSANEIDSATVFIKRTIRNPNMINNVLIGKYLKSVNKLPIDDRRETVILLCYQSLLKKYKLLDPITAEDCAISLSRTKHWKLGVELLPNIKILGNPTRGCILSLVEAAFSNQEYQIGWDLLNGNRIDNLQTDGIESPFLTLIKSIDKQGSYAEFETFLKFSKKKSIVVNKMVADEIRKMLSKKTQSQCFATTIENSRNMCKNCENRLERCIITETEFEEMKTDFYKRVVLGRNIYSKTTPEELLKFMDVLKEKGPWSLVIDGLNVAYMYGKQSNPNYYVKNIERAINLFLQEKKKILLLGRNHMHYWLKDSLDRIKKKSTFFFVQDLSQDDPFLLYATMSSGLGTGYVSRDLMRGHLYKLSKQSTKLTFTKWQQLHQYSIDDKSTIVPPLNYLISCQKVDDYWHLPYLDGTIKWLCLKLE